MRGWQTVKPGTPKDALAFATDLEEPQPREDTVLVEVLAAGMGLPDVFMCQGSYAMTPQIPFTQGQEVVGILVATAATQRRPVAVVELPGLGPVVALVGVVAIDTAKELADPLPIRADAIFDELSPLLDFAVPRVDVMRSALSPGRNEQLGHGSSRGHT